VSRLEDRTYKFFAEDLNDGKFDHFKEKATKLLAFRNEVSAIVKEDPLFYMQKSMYDWFTIFRKEAPEGCNNQDVTNSIEDVYVAYENKRKAYQKNTSVKIQDKIVYHRYKKNTKHKKKGDLKSFEMKGRSTELTKAVSYLTKYYNEGLIEFIKNDVSDNDDINTFRERILYFFDKFGDRLLSLVKAKQARIQEKVFKHPIEFKKLTYSSTTEQVMNIINKNKRKTSKFNAYISLPGQKVPGGKIHIPVKQSDKFHGKISHYFKDPKKNGIRTNHYTMLFEENGLYIALSRKKQINNVVGKKDYYGVDVNIKHNMFADRHGNTIDYDRELIADYVKFLKEIDARKKRKGSNDLSKKDQLQYDRWKVRMDSMLKKQTSLMVDKCKELGYNHIVLENLSSMPKMASRNEEFDGIKYSRLARELNIGSLKNKAYSIAHKNNIQVTFAHADYTSKGCDVCGTIDSRNRRTQEVFECICCGHKADADTHSALLIEDRLAIDVLRESLFNFKDGVYTPKKLSQPTIKKIVSECYAAHTRESG
jgi:hypothetical protein